MLTTLRPPFRVLLCILVLISALAALYLSAQIQVRAEGISSSTTQANWPQWQFNAAHTNYNPYETILSPSTVSQLTLAWSFHPSASEVSSSIVANGVVYFIQGSYLYGRDALTGARKMTKFVSNNYSNFNALSFNNGLLYIGIPQGLIAINATTSRTVWQFSFSGTVLPDPIVAGNLVYIIGGTSGELTLYALNAATGAIQWSYSYTQVGVTTPAVANGIVYLPVGNSLYALNAMTGAVQWTYTIQSGGMSSPSIVNGTVYCYCGVGLAALDAATGTLKWNNTKIPDGSSPLAVAGGVIYFGTGSGTVYAIFAGNGKVKWTAPISTSTIPSLSVANGVLYTSEKNNLFAIDAATGSVLFQQTLGSLYRVSSITSPAIVNGMVYITTINDWTLYAFHLPG